MVGLLRRLSPLVVVALAWALLAVPGGACPFCGMNGPTLAGEVGQARLVLVGNLTNPRPDANNGEGTTDLVLDSIIKNDCKGKPEDIVTGRKTVLLARFVPSDAKSRYLVFCDLFKGKVDPYRVLEVQKDSDVAKYLQGALAVKDEKIGKRLRFFFDYLDSSDIEISNDAYKEFGNADYKDYRDMAKDLPADRVAGWLEDKDHKYRTPSYRYGLYASMLGHCGTKKHADLLRKMLDDPAKRLGSGVDGMLAGYIMLQPKEGWDYAHGILKDPKKEFTIRYATLRTVRFLWDSRPDLVSKKEIKETVALLLDQSDIADLAIDDLRKWQCWDLTDRVLGLRGKPAFEVPIVRRAVLRFALSAKDNPAAAAYVAEQRKKDPQGVADAAELLKLEQMPPSPPTPPAAK